MVVLGTALCNCRFLSFLKALYQDSSCGVKVQDRLSEEFGVGM